MTAIYTPAPPTQTESRPAPTGRPRSADRWDRRAARILCLLLAFVGTWPLIAVSLVRSPWILRWVAQETQQLLRQQGITATYAPSLRLWPLAVALDGVRVDASDKGPAVLECKRVLVRPKLFGLLAGKLAIDEIDLDEPHIRAVIRNGRVANLNLPEAQSASAGRPVIRAPFDVFSVTEGFVDLDIDGVRFDARSIDIDATADDDPLRGSTFEVAVRTGRADLHRARLRADGSISHDDDALCSLEARVRVEPDAILVRRLDASGMADVDASANTTPPCGADPADSRRVKLSVGHLHIGLPQDPASQPSIDGHVRARVPVRLAARAANLPPTEGWTGFDADVRYAKDTLLPDLSGTFEAHDVKVAQYALADLHSEIIIRRNVIRSPRTTLQLANGTVTLSDTLVDPLTGGGKLSTRLDAVDVDFTALMRDLGVHPNSWVGWDVRELHVPLLSGGLGPLKLDGDFTAKTYSFGVYDRPAASPARERLFGFSDAQLAGRVHVRADALNFVDVQAKLPRSRIDGASVSIGFHNDLRVDVPHVQANLDDLSPIGTVPIHGSLEASARVGGKFNHPEPEGDIQAVLGFVVADVAFGDVSAGHVTVDTTKTEVALTGLRVKRKDSAYEVPSAKLRFGGTRGFEVDAVGASEAFRLRDILSMFALDDDPRFEGLDATIATRADVHVALGGPEDACGGGYIAISTKAHLRDVAIFGERFAQGDADMSLRWFDRQRGLPGAELEVRSFLLDKVAPAAGARASETGTVLGSASLKPGGVIAANVLLQNIPLSRIDALGRLATQMDGRISGVAHVTGDLDDFQPEPGLVTRAEIDVTSTRARGVVLPSSHLDVRMTHTVPWQRRSFGRTKCGAPIGPPFDKQSYASDTAAHGEWDVSGDLLGDTVHLRNVVLTRSRSPHVSGRALLRGLDLGPFARILGLDGAEGEDAARAPAAGPIAGQIWGELIVDDLPVTRPSQARASLFLGPTIMSRGAQKLTLAPPSEPVVLTGDTLTMPALAVTLDSPDGFSGRFVLTGGATRVSSDPTIDLQARLDPVDLAILRHLVPRVDRASGRLEGSLRIKGRAASPLVTGELHVSGDDVEIRGAPSAITDVRVDVNASENEVTATGKGNFAGGLVSFEGSAPVRGFELGALASRITVRGVHMVPAEGVSATFDADLELAYDRKAQGGVAPALPRMTGNLTIGTLAYTRPITFNFDLASTRAKRTEVNAYDPALDFVVFDVAVRSRAPIQIRNNLVEVQLGVDSGTVEVTGTNQRVGLRGVLRTIPGGRFHFQANDFEVQTGVIRFEDPTRIAPNVDVTAVTEYRRYTDTSAGAAAGAASGGGAAATGSTRGGSLWRIMLHAYGDADDVRIEMTSEPALSQEDIALLLLVGMTRAELDQLQAGGIGESVALNVLGAASGADRAVKQALPIIDDFRFGSAYSTVTGKTEPQLTVGKRLTNDVRASVTAGLSEDRELRSNIEWRLNNRLSLQGSYDNINDVSSSALGNLGVDLRWRLEFE